MCWFFSLKLVYIYEISITPNYNFNFCNCTFFFMWCYVLNNWPNPISNDRPFGLFLMILPQQEEQDEQQYGIHSYRKMGPVNNNWDRMNTTQLDAPPVPSPRVKSPPWIMKSLITRWNLLPLYVSGLPAGSFCSNFNYNWSTCIYLPAVPVLVAAAKQF